VQLGRRGKKIADFELAVAEETDHIADALYELVFGTAVDHVN